MTQGKGAANVAVHQFRTVSSLCAPIFMGSLVCVDRFNAAGSGVAGPVGAP